jgi:hypothetical protein
MPSVRVASSESVGHRMHDSDKNGPSWLFNAMGSTSGPTRSVDSWMRSILNLNGIDGFNIVCEKPTS